METTKQEGTGPARPLRLGFPVKVVGREGLKSNDTRRWQKNPHLRTSIEYLHAIFAYLAAEQIDMYRISSDIAPYLTHPEKPEFRNQIKEARKDLESLGKAARKQSLRLSFHPSQYIILNSPAEPLTSQSVQDIESQAEILDLMELGPEARIVIHVGGVYDDRTAARDRWMRTYETRLSSSARARLILENDDVSFSASDVLAIHRRVGVPLVFDHQHFWCLNPDGLELQSTVKKFLGTWPRGVRPKIHFSSPRTEMRECIERDRKTKRRRRVLKAPPLVGHADFVNPFEFATFMRDTGGLEFDVMLEAKMKDVALLRLRRDLARCAPDVAERFGVNGAAKAKG
ncbi:MAG TPA: UV DNA damage repair endonuclease UvsE [Chthoniobacterales bacterium]|nr:UV DNA damage repair endonuclease UvsE [Chthoniobacterales bacterium]